REVPEVMTALGAEVNQRIQADVRDGQRVIVMIYGLQRYRQLRRSEDAFGLSMDTEATPQADAQFADVLRDGPAVGLHTILWADTLATIERTLDRQTAREFDYRVLFQMSAADSSNLIDSTAANQLGFHRVLLYSEEQGGIEKFRPYAPLTDEWLALIKQQLVSKL
ncbi:cell division protein FtsK, partial [Planctomycetota bacterium]